MLFTSRLRSAVCPLCSTNLGNVGTVRAWLLIYDIAIKKSSPRLLWESFLDCNLGGRPGKNPKRLKFVVLFSDFHPCPI